MIDIDKLRRRAQAVSGWSNCNQAWLAQSEDVQAAVVGHIDEDGNTYPVATIDCDQYYAARQSLPLAKFYAAANPAAISELLDRLEAAEQERGWHAERCEDAMNERDALRAAVRHEADCVEAAKAEIDALRAKIERADRLEKVESALSDLLNDLEERAKWNLEASQRVVACGNGVYVRAKAALEESK